MSSIRDFNDVVLKLSQLNGRKRVAVACPADSHTEYVVERALREGIADFVLVCAGACTPEFEALREKVRQLPADYFTPLYTLGDQLSQIAVIPWQELDDGLRNRSLFHKKLPLLKITVEIASYCYFPFQK